MKLMIVLDERYNCPINSMRHCAHVDAMDQETFSDYCSGELNHRPKWCPMFEVLTYVPAEQKKLVVLNEPK